ncbi:hypothetical protein PGN35_017945 [Nodosilinea sp. PGN35]|uniref:hypothetical protein n=1 Tax=Nodosilinea sp. PGN35 TaxID=3020489 RepID=UPI0023B29AED|nr:hypothetical protein [Nodosilinea sp. TSF1-S3]MDF0369720.1 hypothetical protein [Nodosilinea sp. TSF1-S3]
METDNVNVEPQITLRRDRSGEQHWTIYDPASDRYSTFRTPDEVLIWLEERHRR